MSPGPRRRAGPVQLGAWVLATILSLAGCTQITSNTVPDLYTDNGTKLNVALFINGASVGHTFRESSAAIPGTDLPPLPWRVEARTSTGRVLATLEVGQTTLAEGGASSHADLSCGSLIIYVGAEPPVERPGPGVPGDCEP